MPTTKVGIRLDFKATSALAAAVAWNHKYKNMIREVEKHGLLGRKADSIKMNGLAAAARAVRKRMRQTAPVRGGTLKRAINVRRERRHVEVNVRIDGAPHWYILEFGRKAGTTPEGYSYPALPPRPFIIPALLQTEQQQLEAAVNAMRRSLDRIRAKRIARIALRPTPR